MGRKQDENNRPAWKYNAHAYLNCESLLDRILGMLENCCCYAQHNFFVKARGAGRRYVHSAIQGERTGTHTLYRVHYS